MVEQAKEATWSKQEEARHLAAEAVEQERQGNKAEARFLADEASALDPSSAKDVLDAEPTNAAGAAT